MQYLDMQHSLKSIGWCCFSYFFQIFLNSLKSICGFKQHLPGVLVMLPLILPYVHQKQRWSLIGSKLKIPYFLLVESPKGECLVVLNVSNKPQVFYWKVTCSLSRQGRIVQNQEDKRNTYKSKGVQVFSIFIFVISYRIMMNFCMSELIFIIIYLFELI